MLVGTTITVIRWRRVKDEPLFEATATTGDGVFETLKAIIKLVLKDLKNR